jgi:hypothetical protein
MKRLISLLAALPVVMILAAPGFAQSPTYSWQVSCSKAEGLGPAATWYWLNSNGQAIPNSARTVGCGGNQISPELIPDIIDGTQVNGIQVDLFIQNGCCGCMAYSTTKKSFQPSDPKFNITESVSGPKVAGDGFIGKVICPYANATLKFNTHSN